MMKAGTPEQRRPGAGRHRPVHPAVAYQKDAVIRYKANPDYFGAASRRSTSWSSPSPRTRPSALAKLLKPANATSPPIRARPIVEKLKADPNLNVQEQEGLNVGYLALNVKKTPFDNKKVRQAFNMAIDKDAIVKAVYQGAGQPAKNRIPPTIWSYNDDIQPYPYDPEKAKALLDGSRRRRTSTSTSGTCRCSVPTTRTPRRIAELMQADLAKVGVTAKLEDL